MRVKIEERARINKVEFADLKPGDIFRKLRNMSIDPGADEVDDLVVHHPETFYMKLLGGNARYDDKCNTVSLCRGSKSHVHKDEFVQPFEHGVLTLWEVV